MLATLPLPDAARGSTAWPVGDCGRLTVTLVAAAAAKAEAPGAPLPPPPSPLLLGMHAVGLTQNRCFPVIRLCHHDRLTGMIDSGGCHSVSVDRPPQGDGHGRCKPVDGGSRRVAPASVAAATATSAAAVLSSNDHEAFQLLKLLRKLFLLCLQLVGGEQFVATLIVLVLLAI